MTYNWELRQSKSKRKKQYLAHLWLVRSKIAVQHRRDTLVSADDKTGFIKAATPVQDQLAGRGDAAVEAVRLRPADLAQEQRAHVADHVTVWRSRPAICARIAAVLTPPPEAHQ